MRGIKLSFGLVGAMALSGCLSELPGGETGPFAPGNEVTFYYQNVLTDPPDQAQIVDCPERLIRAACIVLSNQATFELFPTEAGGVMYGNEDLQVVLQPDEGGVPSGVGQVNNLETGDSRGMRWISLPGRGVVTPAPAQEVADAG